MALQNALPRSLIVVFTDNGSKDLDLEREIVRQVEIVFYHSVVYCFQTNNPPTKFSDFCENFPAFGPRNS